MRRALIVSVVFVVLAIAPSVQVRASAETGAESASAKADSAAQPLSTDAVLNAASDSLKTPDGAELEIRVSDVKTNLGVAGMCLYIGSSEDPDRSLANLVTGGDGSVRIDLAPGEYTVVVKLYLSKEQSPKPIEKTVVMETGRPQRLEIALSPVRTVCGRVVDVEGQPVKGALISFSWVGAAPATSAANGRFESVAKADFPLDFPPGYVAQSFDRNLVSSGPLDPEAENIDIRLEPAAAIRGRVVDEQGNPVKDAAVFAWRRDVPQFRTETTDSDGRYELKCLPAVTDLYIQAQAEGYAIVSRPFPMNDTEDATVQAPDIMLASADSFVAGVAVNAAGEPVADAEVWVDGAGQQRNSARTDKDGRFRVDKLVEGKILVRAHSDGLTPRLVSGILYTSAGDQNVRLVLLLEEDAAE